MPGSSVSTPAAEAKPPAPGRVARRLLFSVGLALLVSLASWMLLHRLGEADLRGDEAIWANTLAAMTPDNAWMGLWPSGEPADRPPLFLWLAFATRPLLADPETQIRLWAALFGIGTVLLTVLLGSRIFSRTVGLLAGWVLVVQGDWIHHFSHGARSGVSDSLLTFFLLVTAGAAWQGLESAGGRRIPWLVAGVALAAIGMLKPPLLLPVCGLLVLLVLLFGRGPTRLRSLLPLAWAAGTCAALLLPWNLAMVSRFGFGKIVGANYLGHMSRRVIEGIPEHLEGPLFYLVEISRPPGVFLLYLPVMILAAIFALGPRNRRGWGLVAIFGLGWVGFFSLVASKRIWYVFPVYPLIALAIAAVLARALSKLAERLRVKPRPWAACAAGALALVVVGSLLVPRSERLIENRERWFDMPWRLYRAITLAPSAGSELVRYRFPIRKGPPTYGFYDRLMTAAGKAREPRALRRIVKQAAAAGTELVVLSEADAPPLDDGTLRLLDEIGAQVRHKYGFRIIILGGRVGPLLLRGGVPNWKTARAQKKPPRTLD